jgi:tricorn protease
VSSTAEETPLLAHAPTVSKTRAVFAYGGYLWSVPRDGGDARQFTTGGHEGLPVFSPDGKWIALTGQYDGNIDVFIMPAEGGEPRRLTWHPAADVAVGRSPDGKRVLYPPLLGGGYVTAPRVAIYGRHGEWEVENRGIAPDIEVENDPASVAAGHDRQLEKAVEVTLEALKKNPVVIPEHSPYPSYHKR